LLAAAGCVLLITCANVAGLLLARGRMRARELAIRLAIGSGRARIVRQLLVESLMLASAAGIGGTLLAVWGVAGFSRYAPTILWTGRITMSPFADPVLDARALLFAVGMTLATSVLCGLAPAIETSRTRLTHVLKEDDRSGSARRRVFRGLVVSEVALAVLLLAAAGLLLESFAGMQRLRQGFDSRNVVTFWVRPPVSRYPVEEGPAVVERLLTSVEQLPGVESPPSTGARHLPAAPAPCSFSAIGRTIRQGRRWWAAITCHRTTSRPSASRSAPAARSPRPIAPAAPVSP
jgi:hypothetical protein